MKKRQAILLLCLIILSSAAAVPVKSADEEIFDKPQDRVAETKHKWSRIFKGMTMDDVRDRLGEPENIIEGVVKTWRYPKGGSINFLNGKVTKITKPFSYDY